VKHRANRQKRSILFSKHEILPLRRGRMRDEQGV
jgi:hypothetical protein